VFLHRKERWFETIDGVAPGAFPTIRALHELSVMRIGLVTIRAPCMRHRFFEISPCVTRVAAHADVFSQQRIRGFRVIEFRAHRLHGDLFPPAGFVARLACPGHRASVRIAVTRAASIKFQPGVFRFSIRSRQVTFLTCDLAMQPGQRIARARVVKVLLPHRDRFPVVVVMALQAILSEAPVVLVLVARDAIAREPQERVPEILVR